MKQPIAGEILQGRFGRNVIRVVAQLVGIGIAQLGIDIPLLGEALCP